jgi:hypothetical protein
MSDRILLGKNNAGDQGFWVSKPGANVLALVGNSYLDSLGDWYAFQEEFTGNGSAVDWTNQSTTLQNLGIYVRPASSRIKPTTNGTILFSPNAGDGSSWIYPTDTFVNSGDFGNTAFVGSEYPIIEVKLRLVDPGNSNNPDATSDPISPDIAMDFVNLPIDETSVTTDTAWFHSGQLTGNTINSWQNTPTGPNPDSSAYVLQLSSNTFDYTDYPTYRDDGKYTTIFTDSEYRIVQWDMSNQDTWMDPYSYITTYDTGNNPHPYTGQYRIKKLYFYFNRNARKGGGNQPIWEIDYIRVKKKGVPKDAGSYGSVRDSLIFSTDWYHSGLVHQSGTVTIGTQKANIDGTTSANLFSDTVKDTDTGIINFPKLPYIPLVLFQRYDPSGNTAYPGGEQEFSIAATQWEDHTYPNTNLGGRNISQVGYDMKLVPDEYVGSSAFRNLPIDWTHLPWEYDRNTSWQYYDESYEDSNLFRYCTYYNRPDSGQYERGGILFNINILPQGARKTTDINISGWTKPRPPYIPDADPQNFGGPSMGGYMKDLFDNPMGPGGGYHSPAYDDTPGKTITTEQLPWKTDIPTHDTNTFKNGFFQSHRAGNNFANQISTFYEARTFAYARAGKDHFALTCRNAIGNEGMEPVLNLAPTLPEEGTANQGLAAYNSMKFMNDNGNWGMFHPAFTLYDTHDGNGPVKFSEGLKLSANTTTSANSLFLDKVGEADPFFPTPPLAFEHPMGDLGVNNQLPAQTYPQFQWSPSFSSHPLIFDGELARPTDDPPTFPRKTLAGSANGFPQFGMMESGGYLASEDYTPASYTDDHGKYAGSTGGFYPYRYHREEKSIGGYMKGDRAGSPSAQTAVYWYEYDIKRLSSKGITHPYGAVPESNSAFTNINGTRGATGQVKNQTAYIGGARNTKTATDSAPTFNNNDANPPVYKYWVLRIPMSISTYTPED